MKKISILLLICIMSSVILFGCDNSTGYVNQSFNAFRISSAKSIPYDVEALNGDGSVRTAVRINNISYNDSENYLTKNRDVEITIKYEVLYKSFMPDDIFSVNIKDKNGNYPLIEDGRMYSSSDSKIEAKDIYLDFKTREEHYIDSITFSIKDIEKGDYVLSVDTIKK